MRESAVCPIATSVISASGTTARAALGSDIIRVSTTTDCFIKFGGATVEAATTDCPLYSFQPGEYFSMEATGYTHIAVITTGGTGSVSVVACK